MGMTMKKLIFVMMLWGCLFTTHANAQCIQNGVSGVPIVFSIPSGVSPSNLHIQFLNQTGSITGFYCEGTNGTVTNLAANTAYSMADITSPVSVGGGAPAGMPAVCISNFGSGRIYVNYGATGLQNLTVGYQPDPSATADANYLYRYQYVEPTIVGTQINVDMSYIDFVSIPISLTAENAPHATNNPQPTNATGLTMADDAATSATSYAGNVLPAPSALLPSANFARVISPYLQGAVYHDWTNYLKTTLQGQTITIKGCFAGVGTQPAAANYCITNNVDSEHCPLYQGQSYDYIAVVNSDGSVTMNAQSDSGNGQTAGVTPANQGQGLGNNSSVTISFDSLNATTGIYGNNAQYSYTYTLNGTPIDHTSVGIENDFFGRVVGDLLAGLSFGFPGSTVAYNGTPIGGLWSTQWWGGTLPDGTTIALANTPAGTGQVFDKAQPGEPLNYHTYAASFNALTTSYGFALQDRLNNNTMAFDTGTDNGSYLLVTINPDSASNPYSISGNVTLKAGGASLSGVTVALSGSATGSTTTGSNGSYSFGNLPNGSYTLTPSMSGYGFNPPSANVTITNQSITGVNFSAVPVYSISGTVKAGTVPLPGVSIALTGAATASTTTGSDGTYSFTGLSAGSYTLQPSMTGYTFKPTSIRATANKNLTGQNFAATTLPTCSISGKVTMKAGGGPLAGVTVALSGSATDSTTTGADGSYSFDNLSKGSYTLTPSMAGCSFNPLTANVAIQNQNVTRNFAATSLLSISGSVLTVGGAPLSGVTVNLSGASTSSTTTDADGSYSFTGLKNGSYTVKPSMTGCTFSPASTTIALNKNATDKNFTAKASISGTVEAGGSPVAGATVKLSGTAKGTATTAANGTYSFSGLLKGQYTLTASKRGYTFNSQPVTITDGNLTGVVISGKQN